MNAEKIRNEMLQTFKEGRICFAEVGINYSSAFFTQLIARNANVRMLSGAEIVMLDKGNNVVAGMSNAEVENGQLGYHFWSGGKSGDSANFSVDKDGILRSKGGEFDGYLVTSCEQLDKKDQELSLSVGAHVFVDRGYTYTLPTLDDKKNGVHFVLVEKVGGNFVAQPYNYVALMGKNNTHYFRGTEILKKDTAYTYPTTLRFRSGILDLVWYNGSWWIYNKNVEWFETDITDAIRKKERIGKQEVVYFSSLSASLVEFPEYTYKNEKFSVNITGDSSYDFTISAAIQETKDNQTGLYELSVTPTTTLDSQKNASVHTTVYKFGDEGNSESCVWRVTQSDVGGASKALPLIVKITYTPFSI
jgi:hypothetical protein